MMSLASPLYYNPAISIFLVLSSTGSFRQEAHQRLLEKEVVALDGSHFLNPANIRQQGPVPPENPGFEGQRCGLPKPVLGRFRCFPFPKG